MVGHTALGAWQSHPILPPSLQGGEGLPGFVLPNDMIDSKSVQGVKPGDSCVIQGIRLMHLLTPSSWSILFLNHIC